MLACYCTVDPRPISFREPFLLQGWSCDKHHDEVYCVYIGTTSSFQLPIDICKSPHVLCRRNFTSMRCRTSIRARSPRLGHPDPKTLEL